MELRHHNHEIAGISTAQGNRAGSLVNNSRHRLLSPGTDILSAAMLLGNYPPMSVSARRTKILAQRRLAKYANRCEKKDNLEQFAAPS
jgi:hypothetical protein